MVLVTPAVEAPTQQKVHMNQEASAHQDSPAYRGIPAQQETSVCREPLHTKTTLHKMPVSTEKL